MQLVRNNLYANCTFCSPHGRSFSVAQVRDKLSNVYNFCCFTLLPICFVKYRLYSSHFTISQYYPSVFYCEVTKKYITYPTSNRLPGYSGFQGNYKFRELYFVGVQIGNLIIKIIVPTFLLSIFVFLYI